MNVNFRFPDGCKEPYEYAEGMPSLPRVGDFIQGSRHQSGRYRVRAIVFEIDDERKRCESVVVELEALDEINPAGSR
jgi:hypothetical protein